MQPERKKKNLALEHHEMNHVNLREKKKFTHVGYHSYYQLIMCYESHCVMEMEYSCSF